MENVMTSSRYSASGSSNLYSVLHVYPGIFTAAGLVHGAFALTKVVGSWSQTIRDKEFLVEMRLRNLEQEQEKNAEQQADGKVEVATEVEE